MQTISSCRRRNRTRSDSEQYPRGPPLFAAVPARGLHECNVSLFPMENQSMNQTASDSAATNRREFLKSSSLAAVGAGVLGSLGSLPGAYAAGDDTIKVGLVGCGGRGTGAAGQAISTKGNVKLVAMGDAFADRLQNSLSELGRTPELQEKLD